MNRLLLALVGVALSGLGLAQFQKVETKPLEVAGATRLEVKTFNGFVKVVAGQEQPSVTISQRGQVSYSINRSGNTLVLEGKKRVTFCVNCEVAFEIRVPAGLTTQITTSNGYVEVTGGVKGLQASTSNGYILTRDTGDTDLTLRTSNGRVEVYNAAGQIRANTSNGRVLLQRVSFPTGSDNWVRTSNGTITLEAPVMPGGMEVQGRTSNSRITFTLQGFSVSLERNSFVARKEGEEGEGRARLALETSNGAITVR